MMLARIRSMPSRGALARLTQQPMTDFECHEVTDTFTAMPRASLRPNERWSPMVYVNNRYLVQLSHVDTATGIVDHLWIRHHAGLMPRTWSDMQAIKNAVVGADRVAVEVFPAESDLVDQANMAHLWVYPLGFVMPFTL